MAPGNYLTTTSVLRMKHIRTTKQAVHVWTTVISAAETLARVNYARGRFAPSRHKGYTDSIDNVTRLTPQDKVYTAEVNNRDRPKC